MKVDISSIRDLRGGSVTFKGEQIIDLSGLEAEVALNQPVAVNGTVTNTGDGFLVQGEVVYTYHTNCNRCLESISGSGNVQIAEQFASYTPADSEEFAYHFQGDSIELTDCVREQVLLSLPMKYTCNDNCRGLCPQCGQNLNKKDCNCHNDNFNPQFSKLKSLLNQEGGGSNGKPKK